MFISPGQPSYYPWFARICQWFHVAKQCWFRCSVAPRSPSDIRNAASPALMLASLSSNPWVSTRFERHADAPPLCIRRMILRELTQGHARVMNIVFWFSSDFKSQCTWIILNNYNNYVLMVHLWKYVGHLTVFDSGLNIESIFMYLKWFKHDIFFNTLVSSDGTWRCEILLARPALAGAHTQAAAVWPWRTKNASCQNWIKRIQIRIKIIESVSTNSNWFKTIQNGQTLVYNTNA